MKQEECHQILELNVQSLCITPYVQYENKLLMKLLASFQQDIKDAIAQQREEGVKTVQFTAEELDSGVRHRTLPLAVLEPNKGHYNRTKLALTDMAEKKLWIPFNNKGILDYVRTPPLFSVDFETRHGRILVNLHFCIDTLRYYLSNQLGYHHINLTTLLSFQRNATLQMYRLYHGSFSLGYTTIRCWKLGQLLGMGKAYPNYKSVKQELLEPACREMEQAFFQKKCDIHFNYAISQNQDRDESNMKKLVFSFYTAQDDHLSPSREAELIDYQTKLWFRLKNSWGVKDEVAKSMCLRIKIWMRAELDDLMLHKQWFADNMKAKQKPLHNPAGYIVKHLGDFLDKKEKMERQQEEKGSKGLPIAHQTSLFPEDNGEKA